MCTIKIDDDNDDVTVPVALEFVFGVAVVVANVPVAAITDPVVVVAVVLLFLVFF